MEFGLTENQVQIRDAAREIVAPFDDDYWSEKDANRQFPQEFYDHLASYGWLGITSSEEYGGGGQGITEATLLLEAIAAGGGAMNAASSVHMTIFGMHPVIVHGSDELKAENLSSIATGETHVCFGVTEPDAGLDTTRISTTATRRGDDYVIRGRKVWISKAMESSKILLLTRTTPRDEVERPTDGLTLFFTDLDRDRVSINPIRKIGRNAVTSNELVFDDLVVPAAHRVGEEGKGFTYILDGLNPERMLIAAEALGIGRAALAKASAYASERVVFDRPIGQNQGIQFPLADSLAHLDAAELALRRATWTYDRGLPSGREANTAKYLCAEAGHTAADRAVQTFGGMGYSEEYHVGSYLREVRLMRIAPVSQEMVLGYLGSKVLGMPRSY